MSVYRFYIANEPSVTRFDNGRNQDYLSHGRRGNTVSGEAQHIAGESDPRRFQERFKSAELQVFLQVDGR